jgi:hypothetical protein
MTNFEKIKAMTIEELAKFFEKYIGCNDDVCTGHCHMGCVASHKKWLESEDEDDEAE